MSLVSLYWDKEYNTPSKIPAEWEIPYTNDVFNIGTDRMYADFSPQAISYRIKDMFLFPVRKPCRSYKRLEVNTSLYFDIGYNLFI